jgi:spore coat protein U-like protein
MLLKRMFIAAALLAAGSYVAAATSPATTTFNVKMTINKACTVNATGSDIQLGPVDWTAAATPVSASNSFAVTCSKKTPYSIGLAPQSDLSSTTGAGTMSCNPCTNSNTDTVPYQLYSDPGYSQVWGTGLNSVASLTGTGSSQPYTVYARVASANYQPDSYQDIVMIYVNF